MDRIFVHHRSNIIMSQKLTFGLLRAVSSSSRRSLLSMVNQTSVGSLRQLLSARHQKLLSTLLQPVEDIDHCGLFEDENAKALAKAIAMMNEHDKKRREDRTYATAHEIVPFNKKSASTLSNNKLIDKVVIFMRHGEAEHNIFERELQSQGKDLREEMLYNEDYPRDPILTKRGFGQALNIARKVADCCNRETKLMPELVVVSPLKRATITALLSFPQNSPLSVRSTNWICHPALTETNHRGNPADTISSVEELSNIFPGIDYTLLFEEQQASFEKQICERKANYVTLPSWEKNMDLLARADSFLDWLNTREERVIVVAGHSTWLQAFCGFSLNYEPREYGWQPFQTGEMRCLAINFQKK